ncbi:Peptidoglycan/LPS O-acetylase OafA/YrhL, contains acyltransferase and SGNH-hydrolase domains [Sphingomonas palmae]|uniref:Peptidoglycan/LPS O-acetylase OafA/YrhL, contains acyltransferase and SGNH-hydrolase domains n=1 Tax=Sphingomonas palmae TaxID=1855283 RepID=A0A1H7KZN6_9SPHN|nr:acyltransferase [Sphingomonas palmae]SEK92283.1 Peptidoglycan/LPS O-acetylase OafA/YrhL, contains acyltransferase and SGNH-hydrolase domains [Sphingomonas palmae]
MTVDASLAQRLRDWRRWPETFGRVTNTHHYVPQIDGLRFLAIAQVVLYHAALRGQRAADPAAMPDGGWFAWLPNGIAGVELFFFISGYIIAYLFLTGRPPRLRAFYLRRVSRLEPPYILTVLICFAAFASVGGNVGPSPALRHADATTPLWKNLLASLFYLHGTMFAASPRVNPPLWTLEIEIQFYLLAPFIIGAYTVVRRTGARAVIATGAVLATLVLQALLDPFARTHYSLAAHLFPFLLGIAVSDWAARRRPFAAPAAAWADAALAIGLLLFVAGSMLFYVRLGSIGRASVLLCRGAAIVLIYLGAARGIRGRRWLGNRWIALVGGACYSIYLLHVPLLQIASRVMLGPIDWSGRPALAVAAVYLFVLPVVVIGCMLFYVTVERPCMNRDWPRALARRLRLIGARR